ncbi:isochorismatase family protein [Spiroplasma culicicola]|uniref:nicotinamidase n=1 Tax=Spiroplasma culicicola AES-1 TaxID=1276246 RepID=W6A6Z2_9MOLU|nr:isochorismatase family protein [Spiroplasma culicicola]AHI52736.1 pyrazinamidase/nicotinamidase [Spiroplasma culicicola AES-1]
MKALIVVDYQYDFADPNGSLYWPEGETLKEGIEQKIKFYKDNNWLVVFTMDWHPENHCSFEIWPPHCIQNTKGAEILVDTSVADFIVKKAVNIDEDSYSGFNFQVKGVAPLEEWLKEQKVEEVEICGLVKQYCVDATYQDALKHGFKASIIEELVK